MWLPAHGYAGRLQTQFLVEGASQRQWEQVAVLDQAQTVEAGL
jgi:hypothetical protein